MNTISPQQELFNQASQVFPQDKLRISDIISDEAIAALENCRQILQKELTKKEINEAWAVLDQNNPDNDMYPILEAVYFGLLHPDYCLVENKAEDNLKAVLDSFSNDQARQHIAALNLKTEQYRVAKSHLMAMVMEATEPITREALLNEEATITKLYMQHRVDSYLSMLLVTLITSENATRNCPTEALPAFNAPDCVKDFVKHMREKNSEVHIEAEREMSQEEYAQLQKEKEQQQDDSPKSE